MGEQIIPISWETEENIVEFDLALTDKLRQFTPRFVEMREKLIEGEDLSVGFGCLPQAHGDCTLGIGTRLSLNNNLIYYQAPSSFGLQIDKCLPSEERWRIFEMPDMSKAHPFVVSVYLKTDSNLGITCVDTSILTVPESPIVGVIAHELSELRMRFGVPLPQNIVDTIELYKSQRNKFELKDVLPGTEKEVEFDLVASILGFKDEILALRDFNIGRLRHYNERTTKGNFYDKHIIQQEFRRDVVTRLTEQK